jgi:1-acyl-sn-glycerol-3-phosphate acyltransferase
MSAAPTGAGGRPAAVGAAAAVAPAPRGFRDGHPFYVLTQYVVAGVLRSLADIRVAGMELCPRSGSGPVLLASNHLSYFDIPLTGAWAPRPTIYFAKSEIREWPLVGGIAAAYGSVFVRRGEADRQAIREALGALAAGQMVGFFPEGHRSHGAGLLRAHPGVALLAQRSGALVWPVAITGTEHIGTRPRPRVTLTGGAPFDPIAAARQTGSARPSHQEIADAVMRRVTALLPERYRGVYR